MKICLKNEGGRKYSVQKKARKERKKQIEEEETVQNKMVDINTKTSFVINVDFYIYHNRFLKKKNNICCLQAMKLNVKNEKDST